MTNYLRNSLGVIILNAKKGLQEEAKWVVNITQEKKKKNQEKTVLVYSIHPCILFPLKTKTSWLQVFSLGKRELSWTYTSIRGYIHLRIDRTNSLYQKRKKRKKNNLAYFKRWSLDSVESSKYSGACQEHSRETGQRKGSWDLLGLPVQWWGLAQWPGVWYKYKTLLFSSSSRW